jgi:hypothetical protein
MDTLYNHLLDLYQNDPVAFEAESQIAKDKIKKYTTLTSYEKLVPYPDYDDPDFNKTIYNKKEFNRNKSSFDAINKCYASTTDHFELSNNQKFLKNFLSPFTPYNGLLLFHSVGVGKSCSAISIAERYYDVYQKKVLIVLSSNIKDNFRKQIFDINKYDIESNTANLCTGTVYPDMILNKHLMKKEDIEKRVNKLINEKYQFIGYKELVLFISKLEDKIQKGEKDKSKHDHLYREKIAEHFSDRLIIIDEAHNLRMPSDTSGKKQISSAFLNLLRQTTNVKLVLMTATPMFNDAAEIVSMLNLLLTNDARPIIETTKLFDKQGNITKQGEQILIESVRGYVSFMRGENPYTFPTRLYPSINNDTNIIKQFPNTDIYGEEIPLSQKIKHLELIGSKMSQTQQKIYDIFAIESVKGNVGYIDADADADADIDVDVDADDIIGKDMQNKIQVSNIIFPSPASATVKLTKNYGKTGFFSAFSKTDQKAFKLSYNPVIKKEFGEILSYNKLNEYSPKIKRIIDYIINSKGTVFVYSQYYYSGILPIALALEHIGFVKYNTNNIGTNFTVTNKFQGAKRPSYIILSRDKDISPNNDHEIAVSKSVENKNGEIIKVVIVSKIGTEGIDFKRIRELHILEPWFNLSRTEQIIGRAVRTCSHADLPPEERNVTIYLHALTYPEEDKESIDLRMYRIADNKNTRIKKVEKLLQENAIDCALNKEVLSFPKNKVQISLDLQTSQGTKVPKFKLGDSKTEVITCSGTDGTNGMDIDNSTFNRVFIVDDILLYKKYISRLFIQKKSYTFDEIYDILNTNYKTIDREILIYALEEMLIDTFKIYDIKKRQGYLIYKSDRYIFQYSKLHDTRMTLEEREEIATSTKQNQLDMQALTDHIPKKIKTEKKAKSVKKKADNKQQNENKQQSENSENIEQQSENSEQQSEDIDINIIKIIMKRYNDKLKVFDPIFGKHKKRFETKIMDFIIDRLTEEEFLNMIQIISKKINAGEQLLEEKNIARSFIDNETLLFDKDDKVKYIYNHFQGELFCIKTDTTFKKCTPIDVAKIGKEKYEEILAHKKVLADTSSPNIRGFMIRKGDDIKFKLKDAGTTSKGYVCTTAVIQTLKDKIIEMDMDIELLTKASKSSLCDVLEIMLRDQGKSVFRRTT